VVIKARRVAASDNRRIMIGKIKKLVDTERRRLHVCNKTNSCCNWCMGTPTDDWCLPSVCLSVCVVYHRY